MELQVNSKMERITYKSAAFNPSANCTHTDDISPSRLSHSTGSRELESGRDGDLRHNRPPRLALP